MTLSVSMEADALDIAQPEPWNPTSAMVSSSTFRNRVTMSPQNGLNPLARRLAPAGSRKFRGCRLCSITISWYSSSSSDICSSLVLVVVGPPC